MDELKTYPNGEERADYVKGALANFRHEGYSPKVLPIVHRFRHLAIDVANRAPQDANLTACLRRLYDTMVLCLATCPPEE
jgi:hypothetical protein